MSRGYGATQRRVLNKLTEHAAAHPPLADFDAQAEHRRRHDERPYSRQCPDPWPSYLSVAALAEHGSRSARESVRRAVIKLEAAGAVELIMLHRNNAATRCIGPYNLCARLAPDSATAATYRQRSDDEAQHRNARLAQLLGGMAV